MPEESAMDKPEASSCAEDRQETLVTRLRLVTGCEGGFASQIPGRAGKAVRSQAGAWEREAKAEKSSALARKELRNE
jgi:hypothetical protein